MSRWLTIKNHKRIVVVDTYSNTQVPRVRGIFGYELCLVSEIWAWRLT